MGRPTIDADDADESTELTITIDKGNKQWVARIDGTDAQYDLDREFISPYGQGTATETVDDGTVIERCYYSHSGNEKGREYYVVAGGELHEVDGDVEDALDDPDAYLPDTGADEDERVAMMDVEDEIGTDDEDDNAEVATDGGEDREEISGELVVGSAINGESHPATATVRGAIVRSDFHNDGRRVIQVVGTMHIDGEDVPIVFRTGVSKARIDDRSALPEHVRPDEDWQRVGFRAADGARETVSEVRDRAAERRDAENAETLDRLDPEVSAGEPTRRGGSGEGSEIRAEGEIETADGRTLGVTWRNVFDAGHATHLDDDDLDAFDDAEVDALSSLAHEESPITRRVRM